ncbi:MAG: hypothetical protein ABR524_11365 [Thermoanaerobaculia bacterium]
MLRKLNFTERLRVPRSALHIALRREEGVLAFDALVSLGDLALPGEARVYLEAYYRASYLRFDLGTVGSIRIPDDRRLDAIEGGNVVRFRLKVVGVGNDQGKILALLDGVTVAERETGARRTPLLPVNFRDLGEEVWSIDAGGADGPVLELNNRIDGIERMARSDARFFALVYPAAIRQILTSILLVEKHEPSDDGEEWWSLWLRWATRLAGAPAFEEGDDYAARAWIDDVARAFSADRKAAQRFIAEIAKGDES